MILFKDNRFELPYRLRLDIARIDSKPIGDNYVKITDEWFANPRLPLGIKIEDILPPATTRARALKEYIELICKEAGLPIDSLFLSVFESAVKEMDEKYAQFKQSHS